jgi:HK97 family phage portal protein
MAFQPGRALVRILKAAVSPLTSLYGTSTIGAARPVRPGVTGWVGEIFAGAWQRGVQVDPIGSIATFGAVYACVTRISNDIAKLGIRLMARRVDGTWEEDESNSPFWQVLSKPNAFQTPIQFIAWWITCKLLHGNAYALKVRDERGVVVRLFPLDPRKVTPLVAPDGSIFYSVNSDDLAQLPTGSTFPAREIIHDRMNCLWHPLVGVSPIIACAMAATQGNSIQANSATFFQNASRPSGVLTAPGTIDDATADRLKERAESAISGQNLGRLLVAGDGLHYEQMTINAVDADLIKQLAWSVEDVARCFGMPLYKINAGPLPTNNNVEALEQQYYSGCLQILIESLESALDTGLDIPNGKRVECDIDSLLRMDTATLIDALGKATEKALMSPDEARRKLNLPPTPGGNAVYLQQQNYSLAALAKRDASDDPFGKATPPARAPVPEPAPPPEDKAAREFLAELVKQLDEVAHA